MSGPFAVKRIKELGYKVFGINIETSNHCPAEKFCDNFFIVPHSSNPHDYLNKILELTSKYDFKYILPLTDPEAYILAKNKKALIQRGVNVLTLDILAIESVRDKYSLFKSKIKWEDNRFTAIPSFITLSDALTFFSYPIVAKPRIGRSSNGLTILNSDSTENFVASDEYIYQPFINGSIITVDAIRIESGKYIKCLPRYELTRTHNGAGVRVEVFEDKYICEFISKLLNFFDINGCVNLELIKSSGIYYLMDFNIRISAGIEFSYLSGYDFIGALIPNQKQFNKHFKLNFKNKIIERISATECIVC
jgi:carbamoyl-phosphate synthase large subunit